MLGLTNMHLLLATLREKDEEMYRRMQSCTYEIGVAKSQKLDDIKIKVNDFV